MRPRLSIRARMTLLYGGVFTAITAAILLATQRVQQGNVGAIVNRGIEQCKDPALGCRIMIPDASSGSGSNELADRLGAQLQSNLRLTTLIAIGVIAVVAFTMCWWITGRLLRPLHHITDTARRLSLSTLHERIALTGRRDELKDLADTFDGMLDRLERAAESQRRFVANASHELRTPLAIQRAGLEVGLDDPTPQEAAEVRAELLRNTLRSERLIEGLLLLAQSERGLDARMPVELATVIDQAVEDHLPRAESDGIVLTTAVRPVTVLGDETLLTHLVTNLVQNAIRHNHPGGRVHLELSPDTGLKVTNTGPPIPADRVDELFQPFRRLHPDRTRSADGAGLGLSIVTAITEAHNGTLHAAPNPGGGLIITVTLPTLAAG